MADLKVGVIGSGGHAQGHLRMIKAEPRMHLTAVAELSEDRLAQAKETFQPDFVYRDYRQMLAEANLDVVYVVTLPVHLTTIVLDCLAEGLHTSVEKPAGMGVSDAVKMADAARNSKGKGILSFNRRYFPEILAVRQMLQDRGGAVHVAAVYHKTHSREKRSERPPEITSDAIHHVDLLRWMAGKTPIEAAKTVEVYAQSWFGEQPGSPRYNAIIGFDSGCRGTMMSQYGVGYRIQEAEVHADGLSAYLDLTRAPNITLYEDGKLRETPLPQIVPDTFNETVHFADCILNDTTPWSNLDDAIETMRLCEAIEQGVKGSLEQ
ncbi:MAG: Gfo/Idh/MocA family oxidoreductase [Chloroflexota bacterium]